MENISKTDFKQRCLDLLTTELTKIGYEPVLLPKKGNNSREISITRKSDGKPLTIQLKTKRDSTAAYPFHKKAETLSSPDYFYVLANLHENSEIKFRIVPSKDIAQATEVDHSTWLHKPGLHGQSHNDNTLRKFYDHDEKYLSAWNILES